MRTLSIFYFYFSFFLTIKKKLYEFMVSIFSHTSVIIENNIEQTTNAKLSYTYISGI